MAESRKSPAPDRDPASEAAPTPALSEEATRTRPSSVVRVEDAAAETNFEPGRDFGGYRLVQMLGRGGFGEVWEATDRASGRHVALKILTAGRGASPEELQRFEREGRLAAAISHPHVVFVFAAQAIDGYPTITLELASGGTLLDRIRRVGPLPPSQAVDLVLDVIDGLEVAHEQGILHRDLKPSNLFFDHDGGVKVGDFGLSRQLTVDVKLTATGAFLGTPAYCSPEQVRGRDLDHRSDIYSLGATLFHMLTGHAPFEGRHGGDVLARVLSEPPPPPDTYGVRVSTGLWRVVLRALAKDPQRRYQTYADLRRDLLPFRSSALTGAGLARRAGAYVIDALVLGVLTAPTLFLSALHVTAIGWFTAFVYFFLWEATWARTPGKWAFHLRVVQREGRPAPAWRLVLRTLVFTALVSGIGLAASWRDPHASALSVALPTAALTSVGAALLWSTMRRRNGYAGLHEIASGTRVVQAIPRRLPGPRIAFVAGGEGPAATGRVGPFVQKTRLWVRGAESLHLAEDPTLLRPVWIHRRPTDGTSVSPSTQGRGGPGDLHWLQGGEDDQGRWDAYEAPPGTALVAWVRRSGPLAWAQALPIVTSALEMLAAADSNQERSFSLARIWVSDHGAVRSLGFPAPGATYETEGSGAFARRDWQRFLRQLLAFVLTGRVIREEDSSEGTIAVPLPESARQAVARVFAGAGSRRDLRETREEWRRLLTRPAAVTPVRRLVAVLLASLFVIVFGAAALMMGMGFLERGATGMWRRSEPDKWDSLDQRRAVGTVLARMECLRHGTCPDFSENLRDSFRRAMLNRDLQGDDSGEEVVALAQAAEEFGRPDADAAARALELAQGQWPQDFPPWYVFPSFMAAFCGSLCGFVAFLGAVAFRAGPAFRLAGITLQNRRGEPAPRRQCAARAVVAWAPFPAALVAAVVTLMAGTGAAAIGLLLALPPLAAVYAVARPAAGIPDWLAGTRLVPR